MPESVVDGAGARPGGPSGRGGPRPYGLGGPVGHGDVLLLQLRRHDLLGGRGRRTQRGLRRVHHPTEVPVRRRRGRGRRDTQAVPGPAAGAYMASAWYKGGSTLGGHPQWIQDWAYPDCPACTTAMDYCRSRDTQTRRRCADALNPPHDQPARPRSPRRYRRGAATQPATSAGTPRSTQQSYGRGGRLPSAWRGLDMQVVACL
jgi:hypothetical protein